MTNLVARAAKIAALCLAMAGLAACGGGGGGGAAPASSGNLLIGKWKPVDGDCKYQLEFVEGSQTISTPDINTGALAAITHPVTYNTADPKLIYVIGETSIATGYRVDTPDRIKQVQYPGCFFERAG